LHADDRDTQREIDGEIRDIVAAVFDAAALEETIGTQSGDADEKIDEGLDGDFKPITVADFERDMSDPATAKNYVLSLAAELITTRARHGHLLEIAQNREAEHARVLNIQAEQHAREIAALQEPKPKPKHSHEHNGRTYSFYGGYCPVCGKS